MNLTVETERETDGRWIAEVSDLPGVLAYGATRERAVANTEALALRVIAENVKRQTGLIVPWREKVGRITFSHSMTERKSAR